MNRSLHPPVPLSAILLCFALTAARAPAVASGDETGRVTFYRDVLPILQQHCQTCHRKGGANLGGVVAPMPLTTFAETRPWARAMARRVDLGSMPPWHAAPEFNGQFVNERTLAPEEIDVLRNWSASGAPAGSHEDAPPPRRFASPNGWRIGRPDLVVKMPEPYFVEDGVEDEYVTFMAPIDAALLPQDRYIAAIEFRPGSSVVHHILTDSLGAMAPGGEPQVFREGYGQLLRRGSSVIFQMHYHKEPGPGSGVWDRSMVALRLHPPGYEPEHRVRLGALGNLDFTIPAFAVTFSAQAEMTFDADALVLSYAPHMHLRGKSALYEAIGADGSTKVLLQVPSYDFNWQTTYTYREPLPVEAGTRIRATMTWDNSPANPHNPDPARQVTFGPKSTDEMMFGFVSYAYVEEPEVASLPLERMQELAGTYDLGSPDDPSPVIIGLNNGGLTVQFPGQTGEAVLGLTMVADRTFSLEVAGIEIEFPEEWHGERLVFRRQGKEDIARRRHHDTR